MVLIRQKNWHRKVRRLLFTSPLFMVCPAEHSNDVHISVVPNGHQTEWYLHGGPIPSSELSNSSTRENITAQAHEESSAEESVAPSHTNADSPFVYSKGRLFTTEATSPQTPLTSHNSFSSLNSKDLMLPGFSQ